MSSLISIIVPCYNQSQYMDECLQSVLDQTYQNWECIIVNDGSPDNTEEVAKIWMGKDARFKYLKKENGGLSSARNAGLEIAKGEWIQFLDCDDKISKEKFKKSALYFFEYDIIITNFFYFSSISSVVGFKDQFSSESFSYDSILSKWDIEFTIPIHCALFKTKNITKVFNEKLKAKEDWLFWIDYLSSYPRLHYISEPLASYRDNHDSITKNVEIMFEQDGVAHYYIFEKLPKDQQKQFLINRIYGKDKVINDYLEKIKNKNTEIIYYKNSKRYKLGHKIATILEKLKII